MEVLKVVQQLRDLAADPENRATIVRDRGCLPSLVLFLDNDDPQVVLTALETLHYLAQVPSNRPLIKNEIGLLISVQRIINRPSSAELKTFAQKLYDLLSPPAGVARPLSQSYSSRSNKFLGVSNRKAKLIVLQVDKLKDQDSRRLVEDKLLRVKGVISFTFNLDQSRCTLRVRSDIKPEILCRVIAETKILSAQQVVKNDHGQEELISFAPSPEASVGHEKENTRPDCLPEYLPEQENEPPADEKAIERSGAVGGGGWFSSVTNFLSNSLYW